MSVYVSVGRNVGSEPMSGQEWHAFCMEVTACVREFAGPVVTEAAGVGHYAGASEDTYVCVGAADSCPPAMRCALSHLARLHHQECVAVVVATPEFVGAAK